MSGIDIYQQILNGDESTSWALFEWEGNNMNVASSGPGGCEELKQHLRDDAVLYGYIRIPLGSDRRNKYVLIKWIGEDVKPLKRARAFESSKKTQEIVKVYHIDLSASRPNEISDQILTERLTVAAGANYDKEQNAGTANISKSSHEFGSYKRTSKDFFKNMESQGNLGKIVYETKALPSSTPVDLGGRAMTASASAAKANIVDLVIKPNQIAEEAA